MASSQTLLDLIPEHLKPLAPLGQEASDIEPGEPIDKTQLGDTYRVRSELLAWLLAAPGGRDMIHYKGIHLRGAKVMDSLDLRDAAIKHPITLQECLIEESMVLDRGEYKLLNFSGSQTNSIFA